ncbi:hypothetical protein CALCODRAFT_502310 [Calocera cornea HHB12733]|uniref:Uncharacterized protein n=1 Tax=Calocera cornea HHB12733 TaxID=1353952 RepID=A0A165DBD2_9BASI|nr:hypothetical protein CALCODRAFT_502310 [Calocera cornea HHB12733]
MYLESDGEQVLLKLWTDEPQDVKELPVLRFFLNLRVLPITRIIAFLCWMRSISPML